MKNFLRITAFISALIFCIKSSHAQPIWHSTIGLINENGSKISAVKVLVDYTNQIYVLSNYQNPIGASNPARKIYLTKYDENGTIIWTYIYDNNGNNNVRAFDMCIDASNNIYIAGGKFDTLPNSVLVFKVSAAGNFVWEKFGNSTFNTDWYNKITFRNNLFYVRGTAGVAVYDQNGNEQYVISQYNTAFDVDFSGRIVLAVYTSSYSLIRYTNSGSIDITDSTIQADKILIDYNNEIYLSSGQMGMQPYQIVKHDSNGQYQWSVSGLPMTPPFGDFSYGLMDTGQNEIVLFGVNDTIIKINNSGQIIWKKNMGGLDDYIVSGKILGNGFILLTGTLNGFAGSDVNTKIYNTNGVEVWGQLYSGLFSGNEFAVDVDVDYNGIYVISQLDDSTNVMKYLNPASASNVDFSLVCVDSAWIDTTGMVQINVFNGNFVHMNYPTVSIVSPLGDTISTGIINLFAQLGNTYQIYQNTINDTTITDFSNYTFIMHNAFNPDTMVQITFCISTPVKANQLQKMSLYPNPVNNEFKVEFNNENRAKLLLIYDSYGKIIFTENNPVSKLQISCNNIPSGMYMMKVIFENNIQHLKFIVNK